MVDKTAVTFSQAAAGTAKVKELVAEIASASQEQSQRLDQINTAVNEMSRVTQQVAANAEESGSASEELNAQAGQMREFVEELIALVNGGESFGLGKKYLTPVTGSELKTGFQALAKSPKAVGGKSQEQLPRLTGASPKEVIPLEEEDVKTF